MNLSKWIRPIAAGDAADEKKTHLTRRQAAGLLGVLLAVSLLLGVLLSRYSFLSLPFYSVGDIARTDIVVPADDLVVDEGATEALKTDAKERVLPVFRLEDAVRGRALSRLATLFARGRVLLDRARTAGGAALRKKHKQNYRTLPSGIKGQLREAVRSAGIGEPSDELLNFLVRERFGAELENRLSSLLQLGFSIPVIDEPMTVRGRTRLTVIDRAKQKEEILPRERVSTLEQARDLVFQELKRDKIIPVARHPEGRRVLEALLIPDLIFDLQETLARQAKAAANVNPVLRQLKKGKIILRRGDEINRDDLIQIEAIRKFSAGSGSVQRAAGMSILIGVFLLTYIVFLRFVHAVHWRFLRLVLLSVMILAGNVLLLKVFWFIGESISQSYAASTLIDRTVFFYVLPYALGAMNITLLAGETSALLYLIFFSPLAGQAVGSDFYGLIYIVMAGLLGVLSVRNVTERLGIIEAGFKTGLAAAAVFIVLQFAGSSSPDLRNWAMGVFFAFLSGSLNAGLLAFTLPLLEHLFRVTTEIRLSELGNVNFPTIRQLILKAPGTYNHSIAVGTLGEGAAGVLGLSPLFLRVAGLYHDIGKTVHPEYFVENQRQGNPHDLIDPQKSAGILKEHVKDGVRIAGEAGLPASLVELIPQHHGTKLMHYFWEKAREQAKPGEKIEEGSFRYPGPKPQTKEAAVLMLADGVEAAARTLTDPSHEKLLALIKEIISSTAEDGQLAECDITLAEIDRLTFSFLDTLSDYYHSRIAYPGFNFK
jgi:cyclic-di-AMP phosphodiesterase PgpH